VKAIASHLEFITEWLGVHDVAVVGYCELLVFGFCYKWANTVRLSGTGGRVQVMPDTDVSAKLGKVALGECLSNQSSIGADHYSTAVGDGNATALLAAVLEGERVQRR